MELTLFLTALLCAVSACFALTRQLQMLQQNSYYPRRYFGWLRKAFSPLCVVSFLWHAGLAALCAFLLPAAPFVAPLAAAFLLAVRVVRARKLQRRSIKKLVFTARVKRLYAAAALLLAALCVGTLFCWQLSIPLLLCSFATPLPLLAAWALTLPFERAVARHYRNDARRILRESPGLRVVGITGSYGKTGTKFILARLLQERFNVVATPESYNTPMGVVRTVRERLRPQTQIFLCEMGAKKPGDIREICEIVDPFFGVITAVGPQHLETFGTLSRVAETKFELADWCRARGGSVFCNGDNAEIRSRATGDGFRLYGTDAQLESHAQNIRYSAQGAAFDLVLGDETVAVQTRLLGMHNVLNITGAAAVAYALGVPITDLQYAISQLTPTPHRLELKRFLSGSTLIDDAYNANPEGCLEAVRVLGAFAGKRKILVTPGLVELGAQEYEANYQLGLAAAGVCDEIVLVGRHRAVPLADAIATTDFPAASLHIVDRFADALAWLQTVADADTAVLFENDLPDNYAG